MDSLMSCRLYVIFTSDKAICEFHKISIPAPKPLNIRKVDYDLGVGKNAANDRSSMEL